MTNQEIAGVFRSIAELLMLQGAEPFRVRTYERAADTVAGLTEELADIAARGALQSLAGIGASLAAKIEELLATGVSELHQRLLAEVPPGLVEMLDIPDVGPKTVRRFYEELGVETVDALEEAARAGRVRALKGFGERSESKLLEHIAQWRRGRERALSAVALAAAEPLLEALRAAPGVLQVSLAGSLRRGRDTTKDIDLLVAAEDGSGAIETFVTQPGVEEVTGRGDTKASVRLRGGLNADLRVIKPASWGAALGYFTGSKAHNIRLRSRARERGLSLNEYGAQPVDAADAGGLLPFATEEELYAALGLPWIPPELREDRGEIEAAEAGALPVLLEAAQIRGDLHVHSTWSDGKHSILDMARAARDRGYSYLAICDHSKSLTIANGLDERRVREQAGEIAAVQEQVPEVRLFCGIEVDILEDGSLDLDLDLLAELDVVVASVHRAFGMEPAAMTARLVNALQTGVVDILGHPTGRMLRHREPYDFDFDAVLDAAVAHRVALEINAAPERLDLDDIAARRARRRGALLVVNTDAHQIAQLEFVRYGVSQARRAWLGAEDVLNTRSPAELERYLRE